MFERKTYRTYWFTVVVTVATTFAMLGCNRKEGGIRSSTTSRPVQPAAEVINRESPPDFVSQTAADGTVHFKVPPTWKPADVDSPGFQAYWWSERGGGGITVSDFPVGKLKDAMAQGEAQLKESFKRHSIVIDEVDLPAGRAGRIRHDSFNKAGLPMRHIQIIWIKNRKSYMLSMSVSPEEYELSIDNLYQIASSVKLP